MKKSCAWLFFRRPALLVFILAALACEPALCSPMSYEATAVTDIKVGDTLYKQAGVKIRFDADTSDIVPVTLPDGSQLASGICTNPAQGWFWMLPKGTARVTITSRGKSITANLLQDQMFVALDECSGGIGFGSFTGSGVEPGYPLSFTTGTAVAFASKGSTPANPAKGTPLTIPGSASGSAFSCIGYPDTCNSPDGYPLKSDLGDIYFYFPYNFLLGGNTLLSQSSSLNYGTFSVFPTPQ